MSSVALLLLSALVLVLCILPYTSTASQAWRPQGRFGKRAAWRPQSRFGKRPSGSNAAGFLSPGGPKRAWRPSSRFGKRGDDVGDDVQQAFEFESSALEKRAWKPQGRFGKREDEMMEGQDEGMMDGLEVIHGEKRAWKPQGRFGKREDEMMEGQEEGMDGLEVIHGEKRAWKPQGRFGKRLIHAQGWRNIMEALKRAWKPQGRFGKRASSEAEEEEEENTMQGVAGAGVASLLSDAQDVVTNPETGETCIPFMTEEGTPLYKCFTAPGAVEDMTVESEQDAH